VVGAVGAVAAVAALGTACAASAGETPAAAEHATAAKPGLARYASCARFAADARARTLRLTGAWGIGAAGPAVDGVVAPATADRAAGGAEGAPATAPMREGVDFSGTNVQEAGVDEPDLVETDGRTVYAIADGAVRFTDVSGGAPRALAPPFTPDDATPTGLLLHDDRLVVIAETGGVWAGPAMRGATIVQADVISTVPWTPPRAVLVELDVADPAHPAVVTRTTVDGSVVGARRAGDTLRVVLSTATQRIPLTQPATASPAAERAAARANRRAVLRARAAAWLPRIRVRNAETGVVRTGPAVACTAVSRPTRFAGVGMLTVLTMDVPNGLRVLDSDAVMSDGDLVYASATGLYIATPRWFDPAAAGDAPPRGSTLVHKLDTSDPARTTYRASGVVAGWLLDQFSMSEHDGRLRVASTEEPDWWAGEDDGASESRVTVLAERNGRLVREGLVTGLGKGERIHAVRFIGDRGYVVTFRQVDPLYVVDLSDPARPAVRGELKIPGFSSYLHPVGDDLLVGIGQSATAQGRTTGTQVSLFDVSDPRAPRRIAQRELDSDWSEAESDHHAVLWWPARRLLVVPVERWSGVGPAALGAVGLDVAPATGITPIARIRHPGDEDAYRPVRRSLVAGDALVTVSDGGILVSDLGSLAPRGWLAFG
jgi:hypothetical protein